MPASEAIATEEYPASYLERQLPKEPPSIDELLERRQKPLTPGWLLDFGTQEGVDVYNSSVPIKYGDKRLVVVREEKRKDEFSSQNRFFSHDSNDRFCLETNISNLSKLSLRWICQDPSLAHIRRNWIITQVEVDPESINDASQDVRHHSAIYAGERLDSLRLIAESPDDMKGVRLVELKDGRIGILHGRDALVTQRVAARAKSALR